MDKLTILQLSEADAKLFIEYQKRYAFVKLLESVGAFDLKSGTLTVNFNNVGEIGSVEVHKHYRIPS